MSNLSILPRLCRSCGRSSRETAFDPMSKHRCTECKKATQAAQAERIEARGPRVTLTVREDGGDCPKHLSWIRRLPCAVLGRDCQGPIHAHHVRTAANAGTGMKPPDRFTVPACAHHHEEGHRIGWLSFEVKYDINLPALAVKLAAASPHLKGQK